MERVVYTGAPEALRGVLNALTSAPRVEAAGPDARANRRGSREHLNFDFIIREPRRRIAERLAIYPAVARFIWMMAANNRLSDIKFHEPKVEKFTDDELTVPGSSYGMRMRQPQPGLDQIKGAIDRLRTDVDSRRAAVAIFHPADAVRESNDIPCAFGLFFHNRGGALRTTVIMRSNNAMTLLPFNLFEFSLLAEVVAVESKLDLGEMTYFAGSMHLYDNDSGRADQFLRSPPASGLPVMAPMPKDCSPLQEITKLAHFEAELRHNSGNLSSQYTNNLIAKIRQDFSPYWADFALILIAGVSSKHNDKLSFDLASAAVSIDLRHYLPRMDDSVLAVGAPRFGPLFDQGAPDTVVVPFTRTSLMQKFASLAEAYETRTGERIGAARLLNAQALISDRLAARGEPNSLTEEVFLNAIEGNG